MPHISKRTLKKEHLDKLYSEFTRSLERASKKNATKQVFYELFTKTERTMLAKRLAVIALLSKGASVLTISEVLGMSPSTVDKMLLKYEYKSYNHIIKFALGKKDIWNILESIFTAGGLVPPMVGKNRWKKINEIIRDQELLES